MRNNGLDPNGDDFDRERFLIALARDQAARATQTENSARAGLALTGSPDRATRDPMQPLRDLLPGYDLQREIHRGGQGVVYQALQKSTHRTVAIKVMKPGPFAGGDDKARFDREVRILGQLNHPSIVAIHDSGTAGGFYYFVMHYVAGQPLDVYLRTNAPALNDTLQLFVKICDAVNAAHLRGIVHRDLKPSNIRIDAHGDPHILDFGLAKGEEGSSAPGETTLPSMTQTGQFIGSLPWASPEQAADVKGGIDVRSDVYSLGVVFYQTLTGTFPYEVTGNMHDVLQHILHAEPIQPSARVGHSSGWRRLIGAGRESFSDSLHVRGHASRYQINDELDTIVLKCLSKVRERRYQNAGELARDVQHYLAGEPIEARRDSLGYVLVKQMRRHRLKFAVGCTFLMVLVSGLIVSLMFWHQAVVAQGDLKFALGQAEQREKDIRQIADAQANMLTNVDPQTMGARLREDVLAEARAALERGGASADEVALRMQELESLLAGAIFTNVSVRSIDRNILMPAPAAIERDFSSQPLVQAALWQAVADAYRKLGRNDAVLPLMERALEKRRHELGDADPGTLDLILGILQLLNDQGKRSEAEAYLQDAFSGHVALLEQRRRSLGEDHPDTLHSVHMVGYLLSQQGRLAEAETYFRKALEGRRRVLGEDDRATLTSMNLVAFVLSKEGKFSEAESLRREVLATTRRVFGEESWDALLSMSNLGALLFAQGRFEEAEPHVRDAFEICHRVFGPDDGRTLMLTRQLASTLAQAGRLEESEPLWRSEVDHDRRLFGENHPITLLSIRNLSLIVLNQAKYAEAEPLCRDALGLARRLLGEDAQDTLSCLNNLGRAARGLGQLDEADELGAEAVRRGRTAQLRDPWILGVYLLHHGLTLAAMNSFEQAEVELTEAQEILLCAPANEQPKRTIDAITALVDLYEAWHAANPDEGLEAKAAEWRACLAEFEAAKP